MLDHTPSPADILAAAEAAVPVLAAHSDWAEREGKLHDAAFAALVEAGVPRLYLPRQLGGYAVDPGTCARVTEILTRGDPSAAWYVMVFNAARLMAARWPAALVRHVWGENPDTLIAASGNTSLQGERDGDEIIVSGRQRFVSGCHHAELMMSPMMMDGAPYFVVVPMSACEIIDNWDTLGMRGTGSNDVVVDAVRIPSELTAPADGEPVLNEFYSDTLYRCPSRVVFATYVPVALELARSALDLLTELAGNKVPYASSSLTPERIGKGLAAYRSAREYFFAALDNVWQAAGEGAEFDARARADLYLAGTHAMQSSAVAFRHVADAAASSATLKENPLERMGRDIETLRHHGFANESRYASVAQVYWDVELDYPLLLR